MQKYSRNQVKQDQRNLITENYQILLEESDYWYDDLSEWEGVPFDGCNCGKCLFVRMYELKMRLYQKHKNKMAVQTLRELLPI